MSKFILLSFCLLIVNMQAAEKNTPAGLAKQIEYHLYLADNKAAYQKAKAAIEKYPHDLAIIKVYIQSMIACDKEKKAIEHFDYYFAHKKSLLDNLDFLENICWKIIDRGTYSSQYYIRLSSLIAGFLAQDSHSVELMGKMMEDPNAIIRAMTTSFVAQYKDEMLKRKVIDRLEKESVWLVRLELIKAIGRMGIYEKQSFLKEIIQDDKNTFEEKASAIESLLSLYEKISAEEIIELAKSSKMGFRQFACMAAVYFKVDGAKAVIYDLIHDINPIVRIEAFNALAVYFRELIPNEKLQIAVSLGIKDHDPTVSITASWLQLLLDSSKSQEIAKWIYSDDKRHSRLAAAAIATSGKQGINLAKEILQKHPDQYVKANVALGLISQRQAIDESLAVLFELLDNKQSLWMWAATQNPLFTQIAPSEIRHMQQMPQYPETMDLMAQLNVLSVLAIFNPDGATGYIQKFLSQKQWGVSAIAASTLLKECSLESIDFVETFLNHKEPNIRIQAALMLAMFAKDNRAFKVLQEAYYSVDREKKMIILEAIAQGGTIGTLDFLIHVLQEPSQTLRIMGASAIIRAINH